MPVLGLSRPHAVPGSALPLEAGMRGRAARCRFSPGCGLAPDRQNAGGRTSCSCSLPACDKLATSAGSRLARGCRVRRMTPRRQEVRRSMMTKRAIVLGIAAVAFAINDAKPATAQAYPSRPITIIVPFAAGGTTDVIARILGEHMSRTLGQQLIVENVVGAGGHPRPAPPQPATPPTLTHT